MPDERGKRVTFEGGKNPLDSVSHSVKDMSVEETPEIVPDPIIYAAAARGDHQENADSENNQRPIEDDRAGRPTAASSGSAVGPSAASSSSSSAIVNSGPSLPERGKRRVFPKAEEAEDDIQRDVRRRLDDEVWFQEVQNEEVINEDDDDGFVGDISKTESSASIDITRYQNHIDTIARKKNPPKTPKK